MPVAYGLFFCLAEGVTEGGWTNIWVLGRAEGPGDWLWDMMAVLWRRQRAGVWVFITLWR